MNCGNGSTNKRTGTNTSTSTGTNTVTGQRTINSSPQRFFYALRQGRDTRRCIYLHQDDLMAQISPRCNNGNGNGNGNGSLGNGNGNSSGKNGNGNGNGNSNGNGNHSGSGENNDSYEYQVFDSMDEALLYIQGTTSSSGGGGAHETNTRTDGDNANANANTNSTSQGGVGVNVNVDDNGDLDNNDNLDQEFQNQNDDDENHSDQNEQQPQQAQPQPQPQPQPPEIVQVNEEEEWEQRYTELVQYHAKYGTADVPTHLIPLGNWVARQRTEYSSYVHRQRGMSNIYSHNRQLVLRQDGNSNGNGNGNGHNNGNGQYRKSRTQSRQDVLTTTGNSPGAASASPSTSASPGSGSGVRNGIQSMTSCMTEERIQKLQRVQFCFGGHMHRKTFQNYVDELIKYRQRNNNQNPPNNSMLHRWVITMEKKYKDFQRQRLRLVLSQHDKGQGHVSSCDTPRNNVNGSDIGNSSSMSRVSVTGMDAEKCSILERLGFNNTSNDDHGDTSTGNGGSGSGSGSGSDMNDRDDTVDAGNVGTQTCARTRAVNHSEGGGTAAANTATTAVARTRHPPTSTVNDNNRESSPVENERTANASSLSSSSSGTVTNDPPSTLPPLSGNLTSQPPAVDGDSETNMSKNNHTTASPTNTRTSTSTSGTRKRRSSTSVNSSTKKKKRPRNNEGLMSDEVWDQMHEELKKFKEVHGHCIPPSQPSSKLRRFVDRQRAEYRRIKAGDSSQLTAFRMQKLSSIGFHFESKVKTRPWEERFDALRRFKENFGHCKVPRLFDQPTYEGLGKWVAEQRTKRNYMLKGKRTSMTPEREKMLTDLGMIWSVFKLPPKEERAERKPWSHRFKELLEFKERHGHTIVPQAYPALGHWVHSQRVNYKLMKQGRKSPMTRQQALKLQEIDFVFEVMPRKNQEVSRQSLGNPFPHLPLIESKNDDPDTQGTTPNINAASREEIGCELSQDSVPGAVPHNESLGNDLSQGIDV